MYTVSELKECLFFDIETIPEHKSLLEMSDAKRGIWLEKYHYKFFDQEVEFRKKELAIKKGVLSIGHVDPTDIPYPSFDEVYIKYAGLLTEFAKIWCISIGAIDPSNKIAVATIQHDDEKEVLKEFIATLKDYKAYKLAGHNINGFDIPFILKRLWINGIKDEYPIQLKLKNAKPWTTTHIDFMMDWKSLGNENVSLGLICEILGVKTPKDKFNNHEFTTLIMNNKITKEEGIAYCEKDVVAVGECMLKCTLMSNFAQAEKKAAWIPKK